MKVLEFLISLRPAIPMSVEKPCIQMSNGELRRQVLQGSVLIDNKKVNINDDIVFPVTSLIFFPNSFNRKTTII